MICGHLKNLVWAKLRDYVISRANRFLDSTSRDKRTVKTISTIFVALRDEGHRGPIEQGFRQSPTRLMSANSSMLATTTKFLQDGIHHDDFGVNVVKHWRISKLKKIEAQ